MVLGLALAFHTIAFDSQVAAFAAALLQQEIGILVVWFAVASL